MIFWSHKVFIASKVISTSSILKDSLMNYGSKTTFNLILYGILYGLSQQSVTFVGHTEVKDNVDWSDTPKLENEILLI